MHNPHDQYRRTRIMTASPGELLVMLYDGVLMRIKRARLHFERGEWEPAGEYLGRCQDILHELMATLDADKAPELAESLLRLYNYTSRRLIEAIGEKSVEALDEVHGLLQPMREAWAEANRQLRATPGSELAVSA